MSAITLDWLINCTNKNLSIESIIKGMVMTDSSGHLYLATEGMVSSSSATYTGTFVNADLTNRTIAGFVHTGILVNHNLGTSVYGYVIKDNLGNLQICAEDYIDDNSTFIIIDSVISGTWEYGFFAI